MSKTVQPVKKTEETEPSPSDKKKGTDQKQEETKPSQNDTSKNSSDNSGQAQDSKKKEYKKVHSRTTVYTLPTKTTLESFGIAYDRNIQADIAISDEVLSFLYSQCSGNLSSEIAGYGHINSELVFDWACVTSIGSSGNVKTSEGDSAWAMKECVKETGNAPNLQLHTHPSFSTYFSATDINDIVEFIDQHRDLTEKGKMYFLVYNREEWTLRLVEWNKDGAWYNDGKIYHNKIALKQGSSGTSKTTYTYSYGKKGGSKGKGGTQAANPPKSNGYYYNYAGYELQDSQAPVTQNWDQLIDDPNDHLIALESLTQRYWTGKTIIEAVTACGTYEIMQILISLKAYSQHQIQARLEKELINSHKSESLSENIDWLVGQAVDLCNGGKAAEMLELLDAMPYAEVRGLLSRLNKSDPDLAVLLGGHYGGWSFPYLYLLLDHNTSQKNFAKSVVVNNNKRIAATLPEDVVAYLVDWIKQLEKLSKKVTIFNGHKASEFIGEKP